MTDYPKCSCGSGLPAAIPLNDEASEHCCEACYADHAVCPDCVQSRTGQCESCLTEVFDNWYQLDGESGTTNRYGG